MDCSRLCRYQHTPTHSVVELDVDSPLRSITGVLNTTSAVATLSSRRARPVVRDARRGGSRRGTLSSRSTPTLFAGCRATDRRSHSSVFASTSRASVCLPPDPMADDGAPRGTPRRGLHAPATTTRPPSRRPGPGRVRVAAPTAMSGTPSPRDDARRPSRPPRPARRRDGPSRRVLADYREENDSSARLSSRWSAPSARPRRLSAPRPRNPPRRSPGSHARRLARIGGSAAEETEQLALELTDDLEA